MNRRRRSGISIPVVLAVAVTWFIVFRSGWLDNDAGSQLATLLLGDETDQIHETTTTFQNLTVPPPGLNITINKTSLVDYDILETSDLHNGLLE